MTDVDKSSVSINLLIDELVKEDKNIQTLLKSLIDSEKSNTEENLNKLINQINIIVTKINNVTYELNKSSHSKMSCEHLKKIKNYLHENRYRTAEEWKDFERYFKESATMMMHKFKNRTINLIEEGQPYGTARRNQKKAINDLIEALKKELNHVVDIGEGFNSEEDDYLASLCDEAEVDGLMSKDPEEKGIITWKPYPPPKKKKGGKRRRKKSRKRRRKTRRKTKRRRKTRRKRTTKRRRRKR